MPEARPAANTRPPRIAVTGVTGQVGAELIRSLQPLGIVAPLSRRELDLSAPDTIAAALDALAPDIVVNPGAYTAVDRAETDYATAHAVNADAPGAIAGWCARHGALLVHYSTDYVFDGQGERPWREDDPTAPINAYGRSKLGGEEAIRASGCAHLILRTSWVYSLNGGNFLRTMARLAATRDHLKIVGDQWGVPTPASFIADVTAQLIMRRRADPALANWSGVLNLAPSGRTNWHDYAVKGLTLLHQATLAAADGNAPARMPLRPHWQVPKLPTFEAIPAASYPTPARRPANSCFDLTRIQEVWGLTMPPWDELLAVVLRDA